MSINIIASTAKDEVFSVYKKSLELHKLEIETIDNTRPWGGFIQLKESQAQPFIDIFFSNTQYEKTKIAGNLTPKILIVKPQAKLSWQYHHRRQEIWKVLQGPVGIVLSNTDNITDVNVFISGSVIEIGNEQRHRLVGLDNWGVVAEIWKHTDPANLSNEDDIIRVQDDYGR